MFTFVVSDKPDAAGFNATLRLTSAAPTTQTQRRTQPTHSHTVNTSAALLPY